MSFWQSLSELPLYDWARQHQLVTAGIEGAHLASAAFFFGAIVLLDLRVLGVGARLVVPSLARLTLTIGIVAFVFVTLTGLFIFGLGAPKWANTPEFGVKLGLIVLGGLNAAAFHITSWRSVDVWGAANRRAPLVAKLFAVGSLALWIAVAILGRYLGYAVLVPDRFMSPEELDLLMQPGGPLDIF